MDTRPENKTEYKELVKSVTPKSKLLTDCLKAFISGGIICTIGEGILTAFTSAGLNETDAALCNSLILIASAVILTGLGFYNKLGKICGAGTIVPITGFANSVASPAIEYKKEGFVFGIGAKMFAVAGPVIVYGTVTSVIVGIIYYILG